MHKVRTTETDVSVARYVSKSVCHVPAPATFGKLVEVLFEVETPGVHGTLFDRSRDPPAAIKRTRKLENLVHCSEHKIRIFRLIAHFWKCGIND